MKKLRLFSGLAMAAIALGGFAQTAETPLTLTPGENSCESDAYYTYWTYTPEADQLVTLTGTSLGTNGDITCNGETIPYFSTSTGDPMIVFGTQAESTYIIKFNKSAAYTFDAEMKPYTYNNGQVESNPIIVGNGEYYLPTIGTVSGYGWMMSYTYKAVYFQYTADMDGWLDISMSTVPESLAWKEADASSYSTITMSTSKVALAIENGKTYLFMVEDLYGMLATFETREPGAPGSSCDEAITAELGENEIPAEAGTYWYKVNVANAGYLTIFSEAEGSLTLLTNCQSTLPKNCDAIAMRLKVNSQESRVFSITKEATDTPVTFNVTVEAAQDFDNADGGEAIEVDTDYTTPAFGGKYYYTVNAPEEGALFLNVAIDSEVAGIKCEINKYDARWDEYNKVASGETTARAEATNGVKYQIVITTPNDARNVPFKVYFSEIEAGQTRSNPKAAAPGENSLEAQPATYFSFVPSNSAWLVVSVPEGVAIPTVSLKSDQYSNPTKSSAEPADGYYAASRWQVMEGVEYILAFGAITEATSFFISEQDYAPGEAAGSAIVIGKSGVEELPEAQGICWYRYNVESDGFAIISSDLSYNVGSKYASVMIYTNDVTGYGTSLPSTYNYNSGSYEFGERKLEVTAGDVLYIKVDKGEEAGKTLKVVVEGPQPGQTAATAIEVEFTDNAATVDVPKIGYSGDPMYYVMHLTPGIFTLTSPEYCTLYLYDGLANTNDNVTMASSTSFSTPDGYMNGFKAVTIAEEGDYYLKVRSCEAATTLNIVLCEPLPGEAASTAIEITFDENPATYEMELLSYGTSRWYKFNLVEGDLNIDAEDMEGLLYSESDLSNSIATLTVVGLEADIETNGMYYLKLTSNWDSQIVTFSGTAIEVGTHDPEPGDSPETAIEISLKEDPTDYEADAVAEGSFCWYKFDLKEGELTIDAKDMAGQLYAESDFTEAIAAFETDEELNSTLNAAIADKGTYYLKVTGNAEAQTVTFSGSAIDVGTGVETIGSNGFAVKAIGGEIAVSGNGMVVVTDLQGRKVASQEICGSATIRLEAGIYIVSNGNAAVKVAVK